MPIQDKQLEWASAQAVTTGTQTSANVVDFGPSGPWGPGSVGSEEVSVGITIDQSFVGGTSVQFQLRSADNSAMSTNLTTEFVSRPYTTAELVAGAKMIFPFEVPIGARRFVDIQTISVGTFTAGAYTARGQAGRQTNR